jgi:trigger factor
VEALKVDYIEESSVRKALAFEIDPDVVQKEIDSRAQGYARKVKLPGFRPGHTPAAVVKTRFRGEILNDAAEAIVNRVVFDELEGRGLRPIAPPRVQDLRIDEGQPMTFRAVFEILPLVDAPSWKDLRATARAAAVSDEDVDREIDRMRESAARFEPVDPRPAQPGDHVLLDLAWRPVEGGKGGRDENALIEIGDPGNHEEMNRGLLGLEVGETRDIQLTWPKDASPNVAGKTVRYTVTLKGIKKKVVPAADDEFAKDLGELATLSELREQTRQKLLSAEVLRVDRDIKASLLQSLAERATFEVPEALVEHHMTARAEGLARGLAYRGIDPRKVGVNWRDYRESTREDSVKAAKADILLDEIARREGIEVTDADLDAELARLASRVGKAREALRAQMEREGELPALRARIREEKTLDLLKTNASIELT